MRTVIGIHPEESSWKLSPGEIFQTPQAVLFASEEGFNGMSREFHALYTGRLFPKQWAKKERPILLNTWEMSYFDVCEEKMLEVIRQAAELGFELVVPDGGWFGSRNDSKSSLGDWSVNEEKFPHGLAPLTDCAREQDIGFGIWFEPEVISPDSGLMRAHAEWAAAYPGVGPLLGRHQLVLDLTRKDVQDYLIRTLSSFLETYPVSYVKWDMNRYVTDAGSLLLPADQTGEFSHRYMLGLYRVLQEVTERFPQVLFENCSSGGGRFDSGRVSIGRRPGAATTPMPWTGRRFSTVPPTPFRHLPLRHMFLQLRTIRRAGTCRFRRVQMSRHRPTWAMSSALPTSQKNSPDLSADTSKNTRTSAASSQTANSTGCAPPLKKTSASGC